MEVGPGPGDFVFDGDPAPSPKWGRSPLPNFSTNFYSTQTAGCITMPLYVEVGFSPGDFVFDGDPAPSPMGAEPPLQFSAHVYCGKTAGWIKMALDMEVGLGLRHIVLDGEPAPLPQNGGRAPHFRPIFIVAKRLDESRWHLAWRWGLNPGDCIRWGPWFPSPKGAKSPIFDQCPLWPNAWMD